MSTKLTPAEKERFQALLMKMVDGEISATEQAEFDRYLEADPDCRKEWQQFTKLKEVTKGMKFKSPSAEVWDAYWLSVYNRLERGVAWILFTLGCVILLTYGGFKLVEAVIGDPTLATVVKAGILLAVGGLVLLVVSVLREKLSMRRTDPYKEVQR
ncbi:MAG: FecR/PupR family sigma factor regulator [Calditrichaeota bacterium]|nr:MAG: FecR/PupR family sigma factor regulator [Calditrichota bacterium]